MVRGGLTGPDTTAKHEQCDQTGAHLARKLFELGQFSLLTLDAAYDTVRSNVDFSRVGAAMVSIQGIYGSDRNTYELPLYFRKDVWLVNPKLHNFTGNPMPAGAEWNIGDWWVG